MTADERSHGPAGPTRNGARAGEMSFRVLVVDDEPEILRSLEDLLSEEGYEVDVAGSGSAALEALAAQAYALVITDLRMPPPDGLALLRTVRERWPQTAVILLTAFATRETAREALRAGALEYVEKPYKEFEMLLRVGRVHERWKLARRSRELEHDRAALEDQREVLSRRVETLEETFAQEATFENLVARSAAMKEVFYLARRVAATDATVLLRGESGTGKTALARAIHLASPRRGRPFLKVNCGALPESLLESELFGHERGAFTGAVRRKEGLLAVAEGGTLFLDEIGDVSAALQLKLLQVIEEKTFLTVGGTRPMQVDVRIITATNRALEEAIAAGTFRADLFYRLNVFPIAIPPLRERREDIPALVERFLKQRRLEPERIEPEAIQALMAHPLPGNVREIENILERALIMAGAGNVTAGAIQPALPAAGPNSSGGIEIPDEGLVLEDLEKELILKALAKAQGNKSKAAALLGLTRRTLYSRMERYGIAR